MESRTPSEWLRLLCKGWAKNNEEVVAATDSLLSSYKPYLGGQLTSQLLCRLSIYGRETLEFPWMDGNTPPSIDFWKILGVEDAFDRAHIVASIERFCSLYNICGGDPNDSSISAAFAPVAGTGDTSHSQPTTPDDADVLSEAGDGIPKVHQRHLKCALKEHEKEVFAIRKAEEKAARAASREERRRKKIETIRKRAEITKKQREGAIKRVAQLVESACAPDFSALAATKPAPAAYQQKQPFLYPGAPFAPWPTSVLAAPPSPVRKNRSSIVISTAADLDQIVTYSNSLWAKYNAIAKEQNKKVKWSMVSKELGINVKVREKYARMHSRATMRGFDFVNWGHYRIKDYPQYFHEPLEAPLPPAIVTDENVSPSDKKTPNPAEEGGFYPQVMRESDQAIFNLAMEVADSRGYSSQPPPEYMVYPMHPYGPYGGFHHHSHVGV